MKTLIVGGGISGLLLAYRLYPSSSITLMERNDHLGGRIHSMDHYECGAYRIHQSHKRVFDLAKELGVTLDPWHIQKVFVNMKAPPRSSEDPHTSMTWWDLHAETGGLKEAEWRDLATGYKEGTDVASEGYPMDMAAKGGWYFAPDGLSQFIHVLSSRLEGKIDLHLSTRVVECVKVGKRYEATFLARRGKSESRTFSQTFDRVIFAVSPIDMTHLTLVKEHGMAVASAVKWQPLHRIYAKVKGLRRDELRLLEKTKIVSPSLLQQTIGCPPFRGKSEASDPWIQVAYCEGQIARFWNDLLLGKGRREFEDRLAKEVNEVLSSFFRRRLSIRLTNIDSHYWSQAVHGWHPTFGKPKEETICYLHPVACPNVVFVNEAVSFRQGWIEGSLESAERFLHSTFSKLKRYKAPRFEVPRDMQWTILNGRLLNVGQWKKVHPGSRKAIDNHLYEDISDIWKVIHAHYPDAWRQVLGLQFGWLK